MSISGNVAVIQLTSDTLSIEYQKGGGQGLGTSSCSMGTDVTSSAKGGDDVAVQEKQEVRCDIRVKGFHLQVRAEKVAHELERVAS